MECPKRSPCDNAKADSCEYRTVLSCTEKLETALRCVDRNTVHFLYEEGFITQEMHDDVLNPRSTLNDHQRAGSLVTGIRNKVELDYHNYYTLLDHLCQSGKQYESIVAILDKEYSRQEQMTQKSGISISREMPPPRRRVREEKQGLAGTSSSYKGARDKMSQRNRCPIKVTLFVMIGGTAVFLWLGYVNILALPPNEDLIHEAHGLCEDCKNTTSSQFKGHYRDCKHAYERGQTTSGIFTIKPNSGPAFQVFCDMSTDGGGWTVFQRRMDGSVEFYRNWKDYEKGFGDLMGEHWLGLQHLHCLSSSSPQELRVDMGDFDNNSCSAHYNSFSVASAAEKYRLQVSGYSGAAGNSLAWHSGMMFTTQDQDNDIHRNVNCATVHRGAWWYARCHDSNLNGHYYQDGGHPDYADGINWYDWKGYQYSLKFTEMKIHSSKAIT